MKTPRQMGKALTTDIFIEKAINVHENFYDYTFVDYKGTKDEVKIICPDHGEFWQTPNAHLCGKGCPDCGYKKTKTRKTTDYIVDRFKKTHGDTYDYSLVDYIKNDVKVKIRCKKHNYVFEQLSDNHLKGYGCPKCGGNYRKKTSDFLDIVDHSKWDYSKVVYIDAKTKVEIVCRKHGSFWQTPDNHISKGHGCHKCTQATSKPELEIKKIIEDLGFTVENSNRVILEGKEVDLYIPELKLAFEFNGLYWHSSKYVKSDYHLNKTKLAEEKGIRLVHIFEDEWVEKKEIVISRLQNILGKTANKIYARNCVVREIESKQSSTFLDDNHIQGKLGSTIKLGLYFEESLVSIMTFGNLRKNLGQNSFSNHYELLRFCNILNTNVIGGASKLWSYFVKMYSPEKVVSYADRRWSQGDLYKKLNFDFVHMSKPNYFYIKSGIKGRESRFKYRKDILVKNGFNKDMTEFEIMDERGYFRIYDCGSMKFEWINKKESLL